MDTWCHTKNINNEYWVVDLQELFMVDKVVLYNRIDCCGERIIGAVIELLSEANEVIVECGSITENKGKYEFNCNGKLAEKVRIRQTKAKYLHFREIEIYGNKFTIDKLKGL